MEKYIVYKSDLKYKNRTNIDDNKCVYDDSASEFIDIDMCTSDYRLDESKKCNYHTLDLSNLDMIMLDRSILTTRINNNYHLIQYLFLGDNDLENIPNLSQLCNLKVLDISHNNISNIDSAGLEYTKLEELVCTNNKLTNLPTKLNHLIRVNASDNVITHIHNYSNIRSVICFNNKITEIDSYKTNKNVKYMNISNNNISALPDNIENIEEIMVNNNNNLSIFPKYKNMRYIEIVNTDIKVIPFLGEDHDIEIICDYDAEIFLAQKYLDNKAYVNIYDDKMMQIIYKKED